MAKVKLDWKNRCQKCGKLQQSTRQRTYRTKDYQGPCGDSFCYGSCSLSACVPQSGVICDACEKILTS